MSERRWLDDATDGPDAEVRGALDDAQRRLPDDVTLRRLWGKISDAIATGIDHPYESMAGAPAMVDETGERIAVRGSLRPARARWPWFVGGVVSSSALALALAFWLGPGRVVTIVGSRVTPPAPVAEPAAPLATAPPEPAAGVASDEQPPAQIVLAPAVVRNGDSAPLRVRLRGGAETRLAPASVLNVAADDRPAVERGEVAFSVPHQPPGQTFSVDAGPFRIVVVGTKFRLRVGEERVAVDVDEGVVEVWRNRRVARLVSGDSWSSPDVLTPAGAGLAVVEAGAAGAPIGAREAPARRTIALRLPASRSSSSSLDAAPAADPVAEARAALAAGDPRRALDAYMAVAARGGPAAENAEYEIGRILRDRLGQPADAIAAWKRYRALHPDGLLRIETDVSIIETLVSSGDAGGALAEANEFLRSHPDSERRGEIARVAGDLYRTRGDCRRAVDAYQSALSAPRGKDVAEYATFHRAACLASLGEPSGSDALEAYLHTWPAGRFSGDAARLLQAANSATSDRARSR